MNPRFDAFDSEPGGRVWQVGALCRAVADALEARFNPVTVRGEISGFSRAASGHCYFSLKDASGQIRCAMFRPAAQALAVLPREGELVEVSGRLGVYEARGDLQLVVEQLRRAGAGARYEQFLRLKARLEAEGLFDPSRKRPLPVLPRAIGLVTSLGAAALHDVVTALRRRVPHIPVVLAPAAVQGAQAPAELVRALEALYARCAARAGGEAGGVAGAGGAEEALPIDVILLVRGGGSIEDLWAFNDETLARTVARSPVPVICGVGHETDFSIADFVADVRAPTPTAAAELVSAPRETWLGALDLLEERLRGALQRTLDQRAQRLDNVAARLGRPRAHLAQEGARLTGLQARLQHGMLTKLEREKTRLRWSSDRFSRNVAQSLQNRSERLDRLGLRLAALDPRAVLQRGYAMLSDPTGERVYTHAAELQPGQTVRATLGDGAVDLQALEQVRSHVPTIGAD